jgi:hypothetical protein
MHFSGNKWSVSMLEQCKTMCCVVVHSSHSSFIHYIKRMEQMTVTVLIGT